MVHQKLTQVLLFLAIFLATGITSHAQQTIAEWNFPNNPDNATVDIALPSNAGITLTSQGGTSAIGFTQAGATTFSANATNWQSGSGVKWWEITINTTGYTNIDVSSKQYSSSTGPRDFKIQYRIGAGVWTDLPGATNIVLAANFTSGVVYAVPLPAACNNQAAVSLRWIMTSNVSVGNSTVASGGNSRIDDINISWSADEYYRSVQNGNWNVVSTWESSPDNITWNPAVMPPSNQSRTITVRNPHTVTINSSVRLDETIVQNGGTLHWFSFFLNIFNGPGTDLQINGTLLDGVSNNVAFATGSSWTLGAAGTVIKTNNGSANNWRDNYNGGIASIPSSATWIIRKVNANNPSVSTLGMYYPNLIVENNTAAPWIATGSSSFQGSTATAVVKGYLDIGGSGANTVEFENTNSFGSAVSVFGNINIRTGNTLRNYGTGFELHSNLICDGSLIYDATDSRQLIFSGGAPQVITGAGNLNIWRMVMNKTAGSLTLFRPVKVDNNITFNNPGGRIFTDAVNLLIVESTATATGANNTSFVHGPVRKLGDAAFVFPTGKNSDYQSIAIGAGTGSGTAAFWSEDFGSGCNTGQLATSYASPNGAWTITNTGVNESTANTWYVSAAENGQGAGACGAACGNNRTLHVSTTYTGDMGAAYLETDAFTCSFIAICSATDKRVESPLINCTGQTGITLSFNYIEFGEGTADNATLWYFDGAVWSQLVDLPKTLCCGGSACDGFTQGLWTAYSIALPASANNNPGIRIGFRWVNNANGVGTDPSFAVDDIRLGVPNAAESFTAEYFRTNPQIVYSNIVNPPLDHVSQCEYWTLLHDAGTSSRTVTLSWDGNSCGITNLADLRVARYNGLSWDDRGNGGTTGTTASGTVISAAAQALFGPFTLSSTTFQNPLPVELISLDANFKNKNVEVQWVTASEINSDYFLVQRSANATAFENIGTVRAAGNSTSTLNYIFTDYKPLKGVSYYRLQQFDFDGQNEITPSVAVESPHQFSSLEIISIYSNSEMEGIFAGVHFPESGTYRFRVFDMTGRLVINREIAVTAGVSLQHLSSSAIERGAYLLHIGSESHTTSKRFIR